MLSDSVTLIRVIFTFETLIPSTVSVRQRFHKGTEEPPTFRAGPLSPRLLFARDSSSAS